MEQNYNLSFKVYKICRHDFLIKPYNNKKHYNICRVIHLSYQSKCWLTSPSIHAINKRECYAMVYRIEWSISWLGIQTLWRCTIGQGTCEMELLGLRYCAIMKVFWHRQKTVRNDANCLLVLNVDVAWSTHHMDEDRDDVGVGDVW